MGETFARVLIILAAAFGVYKFVPIAVPTAQRVIKNPQVVQTEIIKPVGQTVDSVVSSVTEGAGHYSGGPEETLGATDTATNIVTEKVETTVEEVQKDIKALPSEAANQVCQELILKLEKTCTGQ